ncbi:unnamed protein product, partial [Meganyctiphanes norvegica]
MNSNTEHNDAHWSQHFLNKVIPEDIGIQVKEETEVYEEPILNQYIEISVKEKLEFNQCDEVFSRESNLIEHQRVHPVEKAYQCGKIFSNNSYLAHHQKTPTGEKPYQYKQYNKYFPDSIYLNTHKSTHTV